MLTAASCLAADIKLTNGQIYRNVTILGKDSEYLYVRSGYDKLSFPISTVKSVEKEPPGVATALEHATTNPSTAPSEIPAAVPVAGNRFHPLSRGANHCESGARPALRRVEYATSPFR